MITQACNIELTENITIPMNNIVRNEFNSVRCENTIVTYYVHSLCSVTPLALSLYSPMEIPPEVAATQM